MERKRSLKFLYFSSIFVIKYEILLSSNQSFITSTPPTYKHQIAQMHNGHGKLSILHQLTSFFFLSIFLLIYYHTQHFSASKMTNISKIKNSYHQFHKVHYNLTNMIFLPTNQLINPLNTVQIP